MRRQIVSRACPSLRGTRNTHTMDWNGARTLWHVIESGSYPMNIRTECDESGSEINLVLGERTMTTMTTATTATTTVEYAYSSHLGAGHKRLEGGSHNISSEYTIAIYE